MENKKKWSLSNWRHFKNVVEAGTTEEKEKEKEEEVYPKVCSICDEAFSTRMKFQRHMATAHEDLIETTEEEEGDGDWEFDNRKRGFQNKKYVAKKNGEAEKKVKVKEKKDVVWKNRNQGGQSEEEMTRLPRRK